MLSLFSSVGIFVRNFVLDFAQILVWDPSPGLVVLILFIWLAIASVQVIRRYRSRLTAIRKLREKIETGLPQDRESIAHWSEQAAKADSAECSLQEAWHEFDETLVFDTKEPPHLHNSVRPSLFFNVEDLHFGSGFFRICPGLFVSVGLACTFLGLIAALQTMAQSNAITDQAMQHLLQIASAKFIMSLMGLACSIVFTMLLRYLTVKLDKALNGLCGTIEKKLTFVSFEQIGFDQLKAMQEAREHNQALTTQLVAEIGKPLRDELPAAISNSITTAMQPILDKVGQQGSDSLSELASDLSSQLSSSVGAALSQASDRLSTAADRIGQLVTQMDTSSGRMGSEMEQAIVRMGQAVDDLRGTMSETAQTTSGALNQGAEQLLSVMNRTLEGIRDNTSEGARAMSTAAQELSEAARTMRSEMEDAAHAGAEAAQLRMKEAGETANVSIAAAGQSVLSAFGQAGNDIARVASEVSTRANSELIAPITAISERLGSFVEVLDQGATAMRRSADAVRDGAQAGAEAAGTFRSSSQDLIAAAGPIRATTERIEGAMRQMTEGTHNAVSLVTRSAQSTAESAAQVLASASKTLGDERRGIETTLEAVTQVLERLQGQGERLDTIDEELGKAFDLYAIQVEQAMQSIRSHVEEMSKGLNSAVSKLQSIIEQQNEFSPQQGHS